MVRPNPSTFWPWTFWPWTFWILVLLTCPPPAQGQSCLSLPTAPNEIWLGSVIVDDEYMSQPIHRLDYSYHLAGQVRGFVRWGRVAATLGYGTHPRTGRDGTVSFTVGVVAAGGPD